MDKSWHCPNCDEFTETKVIEKEQTLSVKGKKITLTVPVRVCAHCGEEIIDEELDGNTLQQFYEMFAKSSSCPQDSRGSTRKTTGTALILCQQFKKG